MSGQLVQHLRSKRDNRRRRASDYKHPRIGEILLQRGIITHEQLDAAIAEQDKTGQQLGNILFSHGLATRSQLSGALRQQHKYLASMAVMLLQLSNVAFAAPTPEDLKRQMELTSADMTKLNGYHPVHRTEHLLAMHKEKVYLQQRRDAEQRRNNRILSAEVTKLKLPREMLQKIDEYLPLVKQASDRFDVPISLILSIMHTESTFDQRARSSMSAHGLMQIIPRFAGKEAYRMVFKTNGHPTTVQLRDPAVNIMLGTAYLRRLDRTYFGKIRDPDVRQAAVIASYNLGPTKLKKLFDRFGKPKTVEDLRLTLAANAPRETQEYLKKVTSRVRLYSVIRTAKIQVANAEPDSKAAGT